MELNFSLSFVKYIQTKQYDKMNQNLIGFTTSDGRKHLGYRLSTANIGEPWEFGPSINGYFYFDEDPNLSNPVNDVKEVFPVESVNFYFWDSETNMFQIVPAPQKEKKDDALRLFSAEYREWLIYETKSVEMALYRMIREWLLLNSNCTKPVYIHKDYSIHSEGLISIKGDSAKHIPDYIHINNN